MKDMQVDHIISRYKNGTDDLENLNPACRMCNFRKGVYTIEQFREEIQTQAKTAMRTFVNRMSAVYGLISYTPHEVEFYFEKRKKRIIMEENKKVFIRGRKGRGSEVIDILSRLGATNAYKVSCEDENSIYFINHKNTISCALVGSEVAFILMDNFKEIELPPLPWKDGDILAFDKYRGSYAVFKKYADNNLFESYILLFEEEMRFGLTFPITSYHLANKDEKDDFYRRYNYMMSHLKAANTVLK